MACFLLLTFRPDRPLRSVPDFRFSIARPTFLAAPLEYFRFFAFLAIASSPECFSHVLRASANGTLNASEGSFRNRAAWAEEAVDFGASQFAG
jgi:hypothetical protein